MDSNDRALLAGVSAKLGMHLDQDSKMFDRIEGALTRIAEGQSAMNEKLDRSIARVHDRVEEEGAKAINVAMTIGKDLDKTAEDLQKQITGAHTRISKQQIKLYSIAVVAVIGILGWVIEVTGFGRQAGTSSSMTTTTTDTHRGP